LPYGEENNSEKETDLKDQMNIKSDESVNRMTPCPKTPNCVSSVETGQRHFVEPLRFADSAKDAQYRLLRVLNKLKRVRVVTFEENVIQAEFLSSVFGFVDDVEFYFDDRKKIIHVKSASRVGYSDLGANRRRIEKIRKRFDQAEKAVG
jgi:uncharacterized protein (DUF1499 family)